MVSKYSPLLVVLILLFSFTAFNTIAQPTLPDIAGAAEKGIVILSWNCQYNGIRSITVLRSTDSIYHYATIGKVKKLDKGIQAFVDGHPTAGRNYYKLAVLFNSGLTWTTNRCNVNIEQAVGTSPVHLPPNDSIQRYIVTGDRSGNGRMNTVTEPAAKPVVKDNLSVDPEEDDEPPKTKTKAQVNDKDDDEQDTVNVNKPVEPKHKIYISFDMDTITYHTGNATRQPDIQPVQHKIITIAFDDPTEATPMFIRSLYVFTDPAIGHVSMNLPPDVATHHYSIKFYNEQNEMIVEVPRINTSKIIIDKRNFQRKGTYKFVLRKDVTELEQGYLTLNP